MMHLNRRGRLFLYGKLLGRFYYLKFIEKAIPETEWSHLEAKVPLLALRTERTLATLITLWTEVSLFKGTPSVYSGVF